MEISGRTVLLTGATGGIGHAIARTLAGRGARLVLTGRRADVLEPLAAETGGRALAIDLAQRDAVTQLVADAGDIDVLVANAALPASGRLDSYTVEQVDRALEVNLRAPIVLAKELTEAMVHRGSGHVVLISSLSGLVGAANASLYSATKFGLRGFGQGLRADLHGTGVGVSVVFPGFVSDAGLFADSGAELPPGVGTSTPEQVAAAVVRGIERDRGELVVAPLGIRASTKLGQFAPETAARVTRRFGDKVGEQLSAAQSQMR